MATAGKRLPQQNKRMTKVLITGAAGFIGFHLSKFLVTEGYHVVGIDSVNDYYDVSLKRERLNLLKDMQGFRFTEIDICDKPGLDLIFQQECFDLVINLAAQAGVRYSIDKPYKYIDSNLIGFINILEACRNNPVKHLVFASSSSVYGANRDIPFSTDQKTDQPVSLYAATKKANELMAHTYAHLYGIQVSGLRFFTVYGPWGRPDMAYFSFTSNIFDGKPIKLFNYGRMRRDFTYIDDVVKGIGLLLDKLKHTEYKWPDTGVPMRIFNIGNNHPVELIKFVNILEENIGQKAIIEMYPMQDGDVVETFADVTPLKELTGFQPSTTLEKGLEQFVNWYRSRYVK